MKKTINMYKCLPVTIKASFWFTVASMFQKGIAFIATPIYTRLLSTEDYGIYSLYMSWMGVITIFATLNLSAGVLSNALLNEKRFNANDEQVLSNFQFIEMLTIPTVMAVVIGTKLVFPNLIDLPLKVLIMMALSIFFSSSISLWSIKERYRFRYVCVTAVSIGSSIITVIVNILFVSYSNDISFALIYGTTFALIISNIAIMAMNLIKGKSVFNFKLWKYAVWFNLPLIPHYLASTVLSSSDRIMINSICSASDTALYAVAYAVGNIINVFVNAVNSSLGPYTYQKLERGEKGSIKTFTNTVFVLLLLILCMVALFGPEIMYVLGGSKYVDAKWVIPPVATAIVFFFMYPMFANIEFYYEKRIMTMAASVLAAVANIILNIIFIPVFGYIAAAFTTLVCYILLSILHYGFYKKICKEKGLSDVYDEKRVLLFSVAALVIMAVSYLLYMSDIVRYCVMAVSVVLIFAFYRKIISAFKIIIKR